MKYCSRLFRLGAPLLALGIASITAHEGAAQTAADLNSATKSTSPEDLSQTELLRSYLQLREQLHATQLAVLNGKVEAETAARVQAAALTEKLDSIKVAIESERERQRVESQRVALEREHQAAEAQRTNRSFLWVASAFGGMGLLAMLFTPIFQWRAINRVTEGFAARAHLPAAPAPLVSTVALTPVGAGPSDQAVAISNQRLMSVIERVEQRILELEHTAARPPAQSVTIPALEPAVPATQRAAPPEPSRNAPLAREAPVVVEQDPRLTLLLGKGRLLLSSNKVKDALSCYDEILKIEVNHPEALVKKGSTLERLKRDEEAIWCYDRAIESDRKMTLAYLYKGGVFNRQGRYDDALECYEQALQTAEDRP